MSNHDITVNTKPVASQYDGPAEKTIEFSSPVGGGLISFAITPADQLHVHIGRQDMTVAVTAGETGEPVRHGNTRADRALYLAAKAFIADYEVRNPPPAPVPDPAPAEPKNRKPVHAADCGLQGSGLGKHCTCPAGDEGPFESGELIEYISRRTGSAGDYGRWTPGVFRTYLGGRADRSAMVLVWELYAALRGRPGDLLVRREHEVRRIPAELISAARSWTADCEWREEFEAEDIADLSDLQVVAGVQARHAGGWAEFARINSPSGS